MAAASFIEQFLGSLAAEDRKRLHQALGLGDDVPDAAVAEALEPFARAALAEYVDQFIGRQIPTRMKDFQQLRLLYITQHAYEGQLPSPDTVATLFQRDATEARTLVRNTATRYRYELARSMDEAAWNVLSTRTRKAGKDLWSVEVRDLALLEHMNEAVRRGPGYPKGIERSKTEMHVYLLDKPTLSALLASIGHTFEELHEAID